MLPLSSLRRESVAKGWKNVEKKVTAWLSEGETQATRMSRPFMGSAVEDVSWGKFSVEVKSTSTLWPAYLVGWVKQAVTNCQGKIPLVFWHKDGHHISQDYVVMRAEDFRRIAEVYNESTAGGLL